METSHADVARVVGPFPENPLSCPLLPLSEDEMESIRRERGLFGQKGLTSRTELPPDDIYIPLKDFSREGTIVSTNPESEHHEGSLRHESDTPKKSCHLEWIGYKSNWGSGTLYLEPTSGESEIWGECPEGSPFAFQHDILVAGKWPGFLNIGEW